MLIWSADRVSIGIRTRLFPSEPVLVAIAERRLVELAEWNMMAKLAEADLLLRQDGVLEKPTAIYRDLKREMHVPGYPS
jgi:hypothetical protein